MIGCDFYVVVVLLMMIAMRAKHVHLFVQTLQSADRIKLDIDNRLKMYYAAGAKCLRFPSIDRLPPKAAQLFHGVTDRYSSVYNDAVLLFTLNQSFASDE